MSLETSVAEALRSLPAPPADAAGAAKKNYTEALSHRISTALAGELRAKGLAGARAPGQGHDKQFMGGYGSKGVDVYLSTRNTACC